MAHRDKAQEFLGALTERDWERLAAALAPTVRFRGLLPPGPFEEDGPVDAVRRIRSWFGDADSLQVLGSRVATLADRIHVTYRLRVHGPKPAGDGTHVIEQQLYGDVGAEGIRSLDLLCSGFRREIG